MSDSLSLESITFLVVFVLVAFWIIRLFLRMEKKQQENAQTVLHKIEDLEREYVSMKPELAELRVMLDSRVDYPYLEKKMHELVRLVMEKTRHT